MLSPAPRGRRGGFTLIELLVVLAILAVLIALLLPAVQKVREAASRLQCTNHLKQLGLAMYQHHDTRKALPHGGHSVPPAWTADPTKRETQWSWAYHILPYLEQENLYRSDVDTVDRTPLPVYYCPSRRAPQLYNLRAKNDYAGNAGTDPAEGINGVVLRGPYHRVRFSDIIDGTSNTVMLAEKRLNAQMFGQSVDDNEPYNRPGWNFDFDTIRLGNVPPEQDYRRAGAIAPSRGFGSAHPTGLNALFADGSVRHVRYAVDLTTWTRACVANDGAAVDLGEL